ncbi:uncharacterized protein LOC131845279 [Achroia grisella]|uniref:uncharacterized protein LOC131845279 n=1 Tax=Achroia grisella TaxID=688607 RepID=UPI0027D30E7E|nr:uncharacterized protein LOC131845279 [Achroia grisella]
MEAIVLGTLYEKYKEIYVSNLPFCVVCMRTRRDGYMVPPKAIVDFRGITKRNQFEDIAVCSICEEIALNAMKLFKAMHCSRTLINVLKHLQRENLSLQDFSNQLVYFKTVNKYGEKSSIDYKYLLNVVESYCNYAKTQGSTVHTDLSTSNKPPDSPDTNSNRVPETILIDDDNDAPTTTQLAKLLTKPLHLLQKPISNEPAMMTGMKPESYLHTNGPSLFTTPPIINKEVNVNKDIHNKRKRKSPDDNTERSKLDLAAEADESIVEHAIARPRALNASKVDWENKIPMDFIYFTDQGEPSNASCQIKRIRSVTIEENASSNCSTSTW